jgi:RimJ/RimL family protein N-acetyltransferase
VNSDIIRDVERPAPGVMTGQRVTVRPYEDADAPALYQAIISSREHLQPWLPWVGVYHDAGDALAYIRQAQSQALLRQDFALGMFDRQGTFLGGTGLHVRDWAVPAFEIGYWIRKDAEGQGIVSEAIRLITTWAFEEMGAQRVMIRCNARNSRSRRVAERTGFVCEGRFRNGERDTAGELADTLYFAMVPSDFETARERWVD